jgi:hypothetical protein
VAGERERERKINEMCKVLVSKSDKLQNCFSSFNMQLVCRFLRGYGGNGARNHIGRILFSDRRTDLAKTTRSAKTGMVKVPLRGGDTYVTHAAHVWNGSAPLRQATTKAKAKKAASDFASHTPL